MTKSSCFSIKKKNFRMKKPSIKCPLSTIKNEANDFFTVYIELSPRNKEMNINLLFVLN